MGRSEGLVKLILEKVVKAFSGKWQIQILLENSGALSFWPSAVSNIVGEDYRLSKANNLNIVMLFIHFETVS